MADFIDRAKLEALAEEHAPALNADDEELTYPRSALRGFKRSSFLAGAAAYAALLDAETTEEWGVQWRHPDGGLRVAQYNTESGARAELADFRNGPEDRVVSRRVAVTPWLPSEGGES